MEEMSFLAYYFHWPRNEIMNLDHSERRAWCAQVSRINEEINPEAESRNDGKIDFEKMLKARAQRRQLEEKLKTMQGDKKP